MILFHALWTWIKDTSPILGMAGSMWVSGTSRDLRHVGMSVESNHLRLIKPDITINRIIMLISSDRPVVFLPCEMRFIFSWRLEWNDHERECGAVDRRDPVQIVRARWWLIGPRTNPVKERTLEIIVLLLHPGFDWAYQLPLSPKDGTWETLRTNTIFEKRSEKDSVAKFCMVVWKRRNHVYWDYISTKHPPQAVNTISDE